MYIVQLSNVECRRNIDLTGYRKPNGAVWITLKYEKQNIAFNLPKRPCESGTQVRYLPPT